jgi:hypothetical protein
MFDDKRLLAEFVDCQRNARHDIANRERPELRVRMCGGQLSDRAVAAGLAHARRQ